MREQYLRLLFSLLILLLLATPAPSQAQTTITDTIGGSVRDDSGSTIVNLVAMLVDDSDTLQLVTVSAQRPGPDGHVLFQTPRRRAEELAAGRGWRFRGWGLQIEGASCTQQLGQGAIILRSACEAGIIVRPWDSTPLDAAEAVTFVVRDPALGQGRTSGQAGAQAPVAGQPAKATAMSPVGNTFAARNSPTVGVIAPTATRLPSHSGPPAASTGLAPTAVLPPTASGTGAKTAAPAATNSRTAVTTTAPSTTATRPEATTAAATTAIATTTVQPLVADNSGVNVGNAPPASEQPTVLPAGASLPTLSPTPSPAGNNPLAGLPETGMDAVPSGSPTVQPVPLVNEAAVDPLLPAPTAAVGKQQAVPKSSATSTTSGGAATIKPVPTSEWRPTAASQPDEGAATTTGSFELFNYLVAGSGVLLGVLWWGLKLRRRNQAASVAAGQGYGGANAQTMPNMVVGGGSYAPAAIQGYTPPTYADQPVYGDQQVGAGERYELPDIYALEGATSGTLATDEQRVMDDADAAAGDELPFWLQPPSQRITGEVPTLSDEAELPRADTGELAGFGGAWQQEALSSASTEVVGSGASQASSLAGWQPIEEDDWLAPVGVGDRRLE